MVRFWCWTLAQALIWSVVQAISLASNMGPVPVPTSMQSLLQIKTVSQNRVVEDKCRTMEKETVFSGVGCRP